MRLESHVESFIKRTQRLRQKAGRARFADDYVLARVTGQPRILSIRMYNDSETVISAEQLGRSVPRPDAMLLNPPARTRVSDEYAQPQGCMWRVWVQVYFTGGCGVPPGGERAERAPSIRISVGARSLHTDPRVTDDRRQ